MQNWQEDEDEGDDDDGVLLAPINIDMTQRTLPRRIALLTMLYRFSRLLAPMTATAVLPSPSFPQAFPTLPIGRKELTTTM